MLPEFLAVTGLPNIVREVGSTSIRHLRRPDDNSPSLSSTRRTLDFLARHSIFDQGLKAPFRILVFAEPKSPGNCCFESNFHGPPCHRHFAQTLKRIRKVLGKERRALCGTSRSCLQGLGAFVRGQKDSTSEEKGDKEKQEREGN